ncbi:hypothetical protein N7492_009648 [Penicillium capsulatum]|uniref:Mediator of RNA polymerase II transcription subunit 4 n=1 Tax=Penicillium capsulatum TaxID=69766 RepID=A0A9W9HV30_9EURO|nr:hypothetical protein N7492_009648 [Penicillium capsulatum]KAJ6107034.1 hypothetical protein N7512_010551 [Penicillium capsulatum]
MNAAVQSSLSTVESKLNALLTTLTTSPAAAGAPAAAVALLDADDALSSAIDTLRRHQENYAKILRLRAEAEQLEDRVKGIVKDIEGFDQEIRTACGDESDSDSDSDEEGQAVGTKKGFRKEIDYRLLLDFARRISKYNLEAAADAASGVAAKGTPQGSRLQIPDKNVTMMGTNGEPDTEGGTEPVASVTKSATQWLDDSANVTREVWMLPYPMEERIRMGLMGQIQLTAGDNPDKEVDRLIREAEGGVAEAPAPAPLPETRQEEAAKAAVQAGSSASGAPAPAPKPKPKPKALLDLDLYDPDDDDF